ncbi:MAG: P27 family phage terminase small subunit [Sarcina sp.]
MKKEVNKPNYEKAEFDYIQGMSYKEISEKYDVKLNTVKSWKRRYSWTRESTQKKVCVVSEVQNLGNKFEVVKTDLLNQLKANGVSGEQYIDLVETYMEFFKIRNELIADIKERGVSIEWSNGKQFGVKKNDSITELNRTVAQMQSLMNDLGLKPSANNYSTGGDDDDEDL